MHLDTPEKQARQTIDAALVAAGWRVQSRTEINLQAGRGVAASVDTQNRPLIDTSKPAIS